MLAVMVTSGSQLFITVLTDTGMDLYHGDGPSSPLVFWNFRILWSCSILYI